MEIPCDQSAFLKRAPGRCHGRVFDSQLAEGGNEPSPGLQKKVLTFPVDDVKECIFVNLCF